MTREISGTSREFDRYIRRFFVGLSGILFLTTLVCAILFQKHSHPKPDLAEITSQAKSESSLSAYVVTPLTRTGLSQNGSSGVLTWVKSPVDDQSPTGFSSKESLVRTQIVQGSMPSPVAVLTPESSRLSDRVNPMGESNSVRTFRRRTPYPNHRSAHQRTDAQAKRRLLELWHRSLAKSETAQN
jgi:hypothetical protein